MTRRTDVVDRMRSLRPHWVVHCAAWTAVDRAESEPEAAFRVNETSAAIVAEAAADVGAGILYPSTDFVFDGEAAVPYAPDAPVAPLSVYGASKAAGERVVRESGAAHLVCRTSWLFGRDGRNFVDMVRERARQGRRLRVVSDQIGRPTWTRTVALALIELMERDERGITHVADAGQTTWFELALETARMCGLGTEIHPVTSEEWGAPARRPRYGVLDLTDAERRLQRSLPHWKDTLSRYLSRAEAGGAAAPA